MAAYPWLEREDIQACLVLARRLAANERIEPLPTLSNKKRVSVYCYRDAVGRRRDALQPRQNYQTPWELDYEGRGTIM